MGLQTFDERVVLNLSRRIVPADGTASLSFITVNSGDRRYDTILCANRDTIPHVVTLTKTNAGVVTVLGSVSVPAGTGYAGSPTVDLLALILPTTQSGINLQAGETVNVQLAVAVAATFDLDVTAFGGAF